MQRRIFILTLGMFALGTELFVIAGILPAIAHDLGVSLPIAGQLVTIFALTYAIGAPVLASLTGSIARRRLLVGSLWLFSGANLLAALAPTYSVMLIARILAGATAALYTPAASAVAVNLAPPDRRGQSLAMVMAGLNIATILGVPMGTWVGLHYGWRLVFGMVTVLGIVAALGVQLLLPEVPPPPTAGLRARLALLKQPGIVPALIITVVSLMGAFGVYIYIAPLVQGVTQVGATGLGGLFLIFGLSGMFGSWLGGYAIDRWGSTRTLVGSQIVLITALTMLSLGASSFLLVGLAFGIWGVAASAFLPTQQYRLLSLAPTGSTIVLALNSSAIYLGQALAGVFGGLVFTWAGVTNLGLAGAACQVLGLLILFLSTRPRPTRPIDTIQPYEPQGHSSQGMKT